MAIYNAQQLTSASVATYFTNVYGGISASAVRDLNNNWISSSALLSGSQTFYGNQNISGNIFPVVDGQGDIGSDSFKWNKIVVNGELKGSSLNTTGRGAVGTLRISDESFPLSFLSDREIVGDGSGANTHMYYGTSSADVTALREFVYTQSGSNANFGEVSASFNTRIDNINSLTGSYATTGSNTFKGQQIIDSPTNYGGTGLQMISSSITFFGVGGRINFPNGGYFLGNPGDTMAFNTDGVGQQFQVGDSSPTPSFRNLVFRNDTPNGAIQFNNYSGSTTFQNPNGDFAVTASTAVRIQGLVYPNTDGTAGQALITNGSGTLTFGSVSINTGSFATTGSNTFTGVNTFNLRTNLQGVNIYSGSENGIYIGDRTNFAPTTSGIVPANAHTVLGVGALGNFGNGDLNTAIGRSALQNLVSGSNNMAAGGFAGLGLVTGDGNTFIGDQAGNGMVAGYNNFFLGSSSGNAFRSGSFNIHIGSNTQGNLATGSGNLIIGSANGTNVANNVDNQISIKYGTDLSPRRLLYKSGSEASNAYLYGGLEIETTLTASLQQGYVWVGDASNRTTLVSTSSFGTSINTGSFATTGSNTFYGDQNIYGTIQLSGNDASSGSITFPNNSKLQGVFGDQFKFTANDSSAQFVINSSSAALNMIFENRGNSGQLQFLNITGNEYHSASSYTFNGGNATFQGNVIAGNLATTGSNSFRGVENIGDVTGTGFGEVYLLGKSGSLVLGNSTATPTYAALAHISSSQINANTNLIFKTNTNTPDTIVSGSANIFTNANAPTAGFKRYVGGNGNIYLGGTWTQISSSMAFSPTMNRNIGNMVFTARGPVSSSTWTVNDNMVPGTINVGQSATNHAQSIVAGLTISNNMVPGLLNIIANQSGNFNQVVNTSANYFGGATTLNCSGSAVQMSNNIINDAGFTLTNGYWSGSVGTGQLAVNRNNIGGQAHQMIVSGTFAGGATAGPPSWSDNAIFGGNNILYTNVNAAPITASLYMHSAIRNMVAGNALTITGSSNLSLPDTYGSAFFGRWNANDGIRNTTARNVFVVGTGTSETSRKTAFLIDSGSNSYFEGSLNVSGSTAFTGSVAMSSYAVLASVSSSLNFADDTAAAAGGVPLGGLYRNGNFVMIRLT
jgi:hypothetical protein